MRIRLASVPVTSADQDKALAFYTGKLGFVKHRDIPMGPARFLTVVSPEEPDGAELMLEPAGDHPATATWREALYAEGIPVTAFRVDDIAAEHERLGGLGVEFKIAPMDAGDSIIAMLDDTCGNLVMIYEEKGG
jgi:catechol 2,3-dioxygenase-like lactoylglutathione lyase family enzyme